ncbi:hypothetical protein CG719_32050 [Streptomyces sp. CB01373]|nr:hypothetical protein CG719_32050 [Streptomyces sp. CB01373]
MPQAVIGAGLQTGRLALMLGVAFLPRRRRETQTLAQLGQIPVTIALVQAGDHAVDQLPQPRHIHAPSHPLMMRQARARFQTLPGPHTTGRREWPLAQWRPVVVPRMMLPSWFFVAELHQPVYRRDQQSWFRSPVRP